MRNRTALPCSFVSHVSLCSDMLDKYEVGVLAESDKGKAPSVRRGGSASAPVGYYTEVAQSVDRGGLWLVVAFTDLGCAGG